MYVYARACAGTGSDKGSRRVHLYGRGVFACACVHLLRPAEMRAASCAARAAEDPVGLGCARTREATGELGSAAQHTRRHAHPHATTCSWSHTPRVSCNPADGRRIRRRRKKPSVRQKEAVCLAPKSSEPWQASKRPPINETPHLLPYCRGPR